MVQAVAREIDRAGWGQLDAVVFPGGFFHTDVYTGDRDFEGRLNQDSINWSECYFGLRRTQ
jgi:hypothetical protein